MPEDGVIVIGKDAPHLLEGCAVLESPLNPVEVVVLVSQDGEDLDSGFFLRNDPDKASVDESKAFVLG